MYVFNFWILDSNRVLQKITVCGIGFYLLCCWWICKYWWIAITFLLPKFPGKASAVPPFQPLIIFLWVLCWDVIHGHSTDKWQSSVLPNPEHTGYTWWTYSGRFSLCLQFCLQSGKKFLPWKVSNGFVDKKSSSKFSYRC